MSFTGLYTGLSGLQISNAGLQTTSNNISNANTEGYNKQRLEQETLPPLDRWNVEVGQGVTSTKVVRMFNEYLHKDIVTRNEDFKEKEKYFNELSKMNETLFANDDNNLTTLRQNIIDGLSQLADNPTDISINKKIEKDFEAFGNRKNEINQIFENELNRLKTEEKDLISESDNYFKEIERLDKIIAQIEAKGPKHLANSLRDEKNLLEKKLSEIGNLTINRGGETSPLDTYQFDNTKGKLKGINQSISYFEGLQTRLNESIDNDLNKINDIYKNKNGNDLLNNSKMINSLNDTDNSTINDIIDYMKNNEINEKSLTIEIKQQSEITGLESGNTKLHLEYLNKQYERESKVNIDEEMTNMIKYQRAYEANAKVIQTMDEILKTTIDLKR